MEKMLAKIRKLNWLLQKTGEGIPFNELCEILSGLMTSNVYVIDKRGKVLGVYYRIEEDSAAVKDPETGKEVIPKETNSNFMHIKETAVNITKDEAAEIFTLDKSAYNKYSMLVPVYGGGRRVGTLIFSRYDDKYETEDIILGEYGGAVVGIDIERRQNREIERAVKQRAVVQLAIGTLSYTEIDAVQQIFSEIQGSEGLVVASKVAEKTGITRSVIVNGLKKLESAGVIESKSFGMKGTHIKIMNSQLKAELERVMI
ncbi:MAG: GTP-sensing pleiotropic transcriptional regulator CodY [Firmicutes bacterium]|nr:GTP-sensing pleiotropic transcriptional regulator CodY [Bacillota bacterium]